MVPVSTASTVSIYGLPPVFSNEGKQDFYSALYTIGSDQGNYAEKAAYWALSNFVDYLAKEENFFSVVGDNESNHYKQTVFKYLSHHKHLDAAPQAVNWVEKDYAPLFADGKNLNFFNYISQYMGYPIQDPYVNGSKTITVQGSIENSTQGQTTTHTFPVGYSVKQYKLLQSGLPAQNV